MNSELTQKLLNDFPRLYRNRHETSMQGGFACGDGWFDLIYQLSQDIEAAARESGLSPDSPDWPLCRQVKEKMGSLRFVVFAVEGRLGLYEDNILFCEVKIMKRVQQRSIEHADCGVACVAMLAGCSYQQAFEVFGFAENQREFYTRHHHLISALEKLGCAVKRMRFRSWREIVAVLSSRSIARKKVIGIGWRLMGKRFLTPARQGGTEDGFSRRKR